MNSEIQELLGSSLLVGSHEWIMFPPQFAWFVNKQPAILIFESQSTHDRRAQP